MCILGIYNPSKPGPEELFFHKESKFRSVNNSADDLMKRFDNGLSHFTRVLFYKDLT